MIVGLATMDPSPASCDSHPANPIGSPDAIARGRDGDLAVAVPVASGAKAASWIAEKGGGSGFETSSDKDFFCSPCPRQLRFLTPKVSEGRETSRVRVGAGIAVDLEVNLRTLAVAIFGALLELGCGSPGSGAGSGGTWINRTAGTTSAGLPWTGVASDATGTYLVAITTVGDGEPGGDIWTSADAGLTWNNRTQGTAASGQGWKSVASDATGMHLVAVTLFAGLGGGEDVWTSVDAGATWTKRTTVASTAGLVVGPTVASDATGVHLVLADGDIWTSGDAGATWADQTAGTPAAAQSWVDLASDSTATHLVAVNAYSDIWTSGDAGATWINRTAETPASGLDWQSVASGFDRKPSRGCMPVSLTSAGVLYAGDIWTSADAGATWTNRTTGSGASGKLCGSRWRPMRAAAISSPCPHTAA